MSDESQVRAASVEAAWTVLCFAVNNMAAGGMRSLDEEIIPRTAKLLASYGCVVTLTFSPDAKGTIEVQHPDGDPLRMSWDRTRCSW